MSLSTRDLLPTTRDWIIKHGFNPDIPAAIGRHEDTPLILACRLGETAIVNDLLRLPDECIAVNHRNVDGTNALWAAAVANDFDIAKKLLKAGIDINNLNDNGASTLMYASSAGKTQWVRFLLDQGADTEAETLDGFTALDLAANIECLRLLRTTSRSTSA